MPTAGTPPKPVWTVTPTTASASLSWAAVDQGEPLVTKYIVTRDSVRLASINYGTTTKYVDNTVISGRSNR